MPETRHMQKAGRTHSLRVFQEVILFYQGRVTLAGILNPSQGTSAIEREARGLVCYLLFDPAVSDITYMEMATFFGFGVGMAHVKAWIGPVHSKLKREPFAGDVRTLTAKLKIQREALTDEAFAAAVAAFAAPAPRPVQVKALTPAPPAAPKPAPAPLAAPSLPRPTVTAPVPVAPVALPPVAPVPLAAPAVPAPVPSPPPSPTPAAPMLPVVRGKETPASSRPQRSAASIRWEDVSDEEMDSPPAVAKPREPRSLDPRHLPSGVARRPAVDPDSAEEVQRRRRNEMYARMEAGLPASVPVSQPRLASKALQGLPGTARAPVAVDAPPPDLPAKAGFGDDLDDALDSLLDEPTDT